MLNKCFLLDAKEGVHSSWHGVYKELDSDKNQECQLVLVAKNDIFPENRGERKQGEQDIGRF